MKTMKQIIWTAALAGIALGAAALGGEGQANRGRSGERYRNRDPHGPHTGMLHRKGQWDQGWHRGGKKGEGEEKGGKAGHRGGRRGRRPGPRFGMLRRRMHERFKHVDPGKRDELMKRFKEKFEDLDPDKPWNGGQKPRAGQGRRPGLRLGQRPRLRERLKNMDPKKRQELRKRFTGHCKHMRGGQRQGGRCRRPGLRLGQRPRLREHLKNMAPKRRQELRKRILERIKDLPAEKRAEIEKRLKEHWDRGLHRGKDAEKGKGGGRFGKDRTKWDDYQGKPGKGNKNPAGPKGK
jgi:hypothetical protein